MTSEQTHLPNDPNSAASQVPPSQPPTSRRASSRRRRRVAEPGGGAAAPAASAEVEVVADGPAGGARLDQAAEGDEGYGDETAFYRFSAFLGLAAAAVLAAAVVSYSAAGSLTKQTVALLIVAAVLATLYVIPRLGEITALLRTRPARQGGNVTIASVAFIGLLIVVNWLANRHSPQWDLTALRKYSLAPQTVQILDGLTQDVKVTAFFPSRQEDSFTRGTKDLLLLYARRSPHIKLEFIDPEVNPGAAQQFGIKSYPITIFQMGDRREETTGLTEQDFTSALLKVARPTQKKVYFLQGHQERDPDSAQQNGYNSAAQALKREGYVVDKLSLLATGNKVPDDAAAVIIAGLRAPLLDPEKQALDDYLNNRGGHLLVLAEPRTDLDGLNDLLARWYVKVDDDIVIDPGRSYPGDPLTPAPIPQTGHRISSSLPDLLLPGARSVTILPGAGADFAIAPLLKSTDRAWGETDFSGAPAKYDDGIDVKGPVTFAVAINQSEPTPTFSPGVTPTPTPAANESKPKGRLVVVGNAEFASNTYFGQVLGNSDFFVNCVDWLTEEESLISIRAQPQEEPPIVLTSQSSVLVLYTTVFFIPLAVLLAGGIVWWQRR